MLGNGLVQSLKPVPGFGFEAEEVANDLFGIPVEDNNKIHPTPVPEFDLGHTVKLVLLCCVDVPELVEMISLNLWLHGSTAGPQAHVLGDHELVLLHNAVDTFLVDGKAFPVLEVGPDTAVTPEGVLGLEIENTL